MKKKGALFFTVDTMIAGLIFTMTVIVVLSFYVRQPIIEDTQTILENYATYVTTVKMSTFNTNRVIYYDPIEPDPGFGVHQKILKLNVTNNNDQARGFIENFTRVVVPPQFGVQYSIDDYIIFERSSPNDEYTETNLTTKIISFYFDGTTLIGPHITRLSVWS